MVSTQTILYDYDVFDDTFPVTIESTIPSRHAQSTVIRHLRYGTFPILPMSALIEFST
jgi:hypothetical protein